MPVPVTIADLSATAASNSPAGAESVSAAVGPDDYLRAHAAIIKTLANSVTTDIASVTTDIATAVSNHAAAADPHPLYALESALGTASTKDTGTASGNVPLVGTESATTTVAGLVRKSTAVENAAGTGTGVVAAADLPAAVAAAVNASGAAPTYACRAWVNFNGTGTVAIRASGNVSSITDNGTGDYTVNFTTAMPDANYSVAGTANDGGNGASAGFVGAGILTTGSVRVYVRSAAAAALDTAFTCISIFR